MSSAPDLARTLAALEPGCTDDEAQRFFDMLEPIAADRMFGRWRGSEVHTGHPLDGLLESYGWYGKEFVDLETVHPLLFEDGRGETFAVDPRKVPMDLAPHVPRGPASVVKRALSLVRSVVGTSKPRARLRNLEFRGKVSAAMIYDHLPIQDAFRRVDEDTLLGAMDRRGDARLRYVVLRRVT